MFALPVKRGVSAAAFVALLLAGPQAGAAEDAAGDWAERVQIIYDAETRSVERVRLRVWDDQPGRNLEFLWEPDPATAFDPAATGGVVEGRGRLVWRVRGSVAHDRRAIYSTYAGEMKGGRPHGRGRLERRNGEAFEGEWTAGLLHGSGMHLDAAGNRYTGDFRNGLPHGYGRQAMADGSIYEGGFSDGRREGAGISRLPGGGEYASQWRAGVEVGTARPDAMADATVGGLLSAQSGGGDAGKIDLSVVVEQRMNQQATLRYTHVVLDEHIEIFPENPGMVDVWIGQGVIRPGGYSVTFGEIDWDNAPAFLQVSFETADGSRVRLDKLELQVEDSEVYRKPFLSVVSHEGCVGYRPSFSFQNNGWGPVREASLSLEFFNQEDLGQASRAFSVDVGDFDEGGEVSLHSLLTEAGVDTAALAEARFNCPSLEQIPQCREQVLGSVRFGEIGPLLTGGLDLSVGVRGRLTYSWADDRGNVHEENEPVEASVHIGFIETEMMVAEGGDGWGVSPEALRYQEVRLPSDQRNYVVDMPVRGNRNLAAYVARLKVFAEETSVHRFRAAARFADGSERYSKPVSLFHVRPRENWYEPPEPEAACYLDPGYFGGSKG